MLHLKNVNRQYHVAGNTITGLNNISLDVEPGDFVCVRGHSGSGKTTLLLTLGGMQRPNSGTVVLADIPDLYAISSAARTRARAKHIGFIFQMFHLVPYLNVLDNIQLGIVDGANNNANNNNNKAAAEALIEKLGLEHRLRHRPDQLSVGECQRVAVARALISQPSILLADEPTGNLDAENANIVLQAFQDFCANGGVLLLATHGEKPIECANRLLTINSGVVEEQTITCEATV